MINSIVIMGRLTADPVLKNTSSGVEYVNFRVAVDKAYKSKEDEQQTDFINVVAWRKTAVFITQYFQKGQMIALQGTLQVRSYDDKNGNKKYITEVLAQNVSFCGSKNDRNNSVVDDVNTQQLDDNFTLNEEYPF